MLTISIITICKNAQDVIEKTTASVFSQTYPHIEYIIIDGGSTDNTLPVINQYKDKIDRIISEPDKGIYDAMNKGINIAKGDILYFLNAGDYLYDKNIVEKVAKEFEKSNASIVYGKSIYKNIPEKIGKRYTDRNFIFQNKMDVVKHVSPQQCFFYKKETFNQIGTFDTNLKIAADMDWFLRSLNKKISNHYIDEYTCVCGLGGTSSSSHIKERITVFWKNMNIFEFLYYSIFAITRQCIRFSKRERLN